MLDNVLNYTLHHQRVIHLDIKTFLFKVHCCPNIWDQKDLINAVLWKKKSITVSTKKILSSTTVFNIANKKICFLSKISTFSERSCDTKDWSNHAEKSAVSSQE